LQSMGLADKVIKPTHVSGELAGSAMVEKSWSRKAPRCRLGRYMARLTQRNRVWPAWGRLPGEAGLP